MTTTSTRAGRRAASSSRRRSWGAGWCHHEPRRTDDDAPSCSCCPPQAGAPRASIFVTTRAPPTHVDDDLCYCRTRLPPPRSLSRLSSSSLAPLLDCRHDEKRVRGGSSTRKAAASTHDMENGGGEQHGQDARRGPAAPPSLSEPLRLTYSSSKKSRSEIVCFFACTATIYAVQQKNATPPVRHVRWMVLGDATLIVVSPVTATCSAVRGASEQEAGSSSISA